MVMGHCNAGHGLHIIRLQEAESSPSCVMHYHEWRPGSMPAAARLPAPRPNLTLDVSRFVGPKPEHGWQLEWERAYREDLRNRGRASPSAEAFYPGCECSIEAEIVKKHAEITWKIQQGWDREKAAGYTVLSSCVPEPLGRALREGKMSKRETNPEFAACTHFIVEALAHAAEKQTTAAPLCYRNLTGRFGLAEQVGMQSAASTPPPGGQGQRVMSFLLHSQHAV